MEPKTYIFLNTKTGEIILMDKYAVPSKGKQWEWVLISQEAYDKIIESK